MDPAQYIDSIALEEALLHQVANLAAAALQKIEERKEEEQRRKDDALLMLLKPKLFADTYADIQADLETLIIESMRLGGIEFTDAYDGIADELWEIAKPALYENFYGNVSVAHKWRDGVAQLTRTCDSGYCKCSRDQIPIPIHISRWRRNFFLCDACYDSWSDDAILDEIGPELENEFCRYARSQLSKTFLSKRIKVE